MFHVLGYGIPKFRSISTGCVKSPIFTNFPFHFPPIFPFPFFKQFPLPFHPLFHLLTLTLSMS